MRKKTGKQIVSLILAVWILLTASASAFDCPIVAEEAAETAVAAAAAASDGENDYAAYLSALPACDMSAAPAIDVPIAENPAMERGGSVTLSVDVPENGRYTIRVEYRVIEPVDEKVEFRLLLDGALPFEECGVLRLKALYIDTLDTFRLSSSGDEITPELSLCDAVQQYRLADDEGYYSEPYVFYLEQGFHTLTMETEAGKAVLSGVRLIPEQEEESYAAYYERLCSRGVTDASNTCMVTQAERPDFRTSNVIMAFCESTSASTEPAAADKQVLNALGGSTWNLSGQAATWNFEVESSGFYCISIKYLQDYTTGAPVSRRLLIDGEVPFRELADVNFSYSAHWKNQIMGEEDGTPYRVYLEAGAHTLTLEATMGEKAEYLRQAQQYMQDLNTAYRQIIMLTSTSPDAYRDYSLDEKIPDTISSLETLSTAFSELKEALQELGGVNTGVISRLAVQLHRLYEKPENIPKQLSQLKANISALGTWVYNFSEQPLAVDSWTLFSPELQPLSANVGWFSQLLHGIRRFIYSFSEDYRQEENEQDVLEVWAPTGRDQVQILKHLIEEDFELKNEVKVNLRMVDSGAILPAMVAGIGPDIYLMASSGDPVNYAVRGALTDLTRFDDYESVAERFHASASVPFRLSGKVFALPETQTFTMLFYRTDIFAELGLEVPKTWDDVVDLLFDLNKKNMEFGLPASLNTYVTLLSQAGGQLYNDAGTATVMDNSTGLLAFDEYCRYYSRYGVPVSYDFVNRFRSGEMPAALAEYTSYNTLKVFAPELDGLYDIAPVPGTLQADGTVAHDTVGTVTGCFLLEDSSVKEAGWEFLKWWTSADIQYRYGQSIENKLGASARYATANLEALKRLPWSEEFYKKLSAQMEWLKGIPEVPGGYFTGRHFNNAFRSVVYSGTNAQETLLEYCEVINKEIKSKHEEFGLWAE